MAAAITERRLSSAKSRNGAYTFLTNHFSPLSQLCCNQVTTGISSRNG